MARIHGLFGSALRGSAAKSTFSKSAFSSDTIMRAKPSSVKNPRTYGQVAARYRASILTAVYSELHRVLDHSFEGCPAGSKSMARFLRLNQPIVANYAKLNEVCFSTAKAMDGTIIPLSSVKLPLIMSSGSLPSLNYKVNFMNTYQFGSNSSALSSAADVAQWLGVSLGDQVTFVMLKLLGGGAFYSIILPANAEEVVVKDGVWVGPIAKGNSGSGKIFMKPPFDGMPNRVYFEDVGDPAKGGDLIGCGAAIVSRFEGSVWRYSNAVMALNRTASDYETFRDAVLSRNPSATEFLNQSK